MSRTCDAAGHQFIPIEVEENNIFAGIYKILSVIKPNWPENNIKFKVVLNLIVVNIKICHVNNNLAIVTVIY